MYPDLYGNRSIITLNKRRKIENQTINGITAKVSEIEVEPINCELKKTFCEENKFASNKQQVSTTNDKKYPVEIFRPYLQ